MYPCVCVCICVHVCMYVYVCVHVHACININRCVTYSGSSVQVYCSHAKGCLLSAGRSKKREENGDPTSVVGLLPAGGVMSNQPHGGSEVSCSCKASSSSLIGGSGAGWEGTALLHHGSLIKLGCLQFVFSITEFTNKLPKEEQSTIPSSSTTSNAPTTILPPPPNTATASSPSSQDEGDIEAVPSHQVPELHSNSVP